MLLEESVAQPISECFSTEPDLCQQLLQHRRIPLFAVGTSQYFTQTLVCRRFTLDGRQAHDAITLGQFFQTIRTQCCAVWKTGTRLAWPLVIQQTCYRDLQRLV